MVDGSGRGCVAAAGSSVSNSTSADGFLNDCGPGRMIPLPPVGSKAPARAWKLFAAVETRSPNILELARAICDWTPQACTGLVEQLSPPANAESQQNAVIAARRTNKILDNPRLLPACFFIDAPPFSTLASVEGCENISRGISSTIAATQIVSIVQITNQFHNETLQSITTSL